MDLLQSRGELNPEQLAEIEALSRGELVELLVESNRQWYQLLDGLEAAHKRDMQGLSADFLGQLTVAVEGMKSTDATQWRHMKETLTASEKKLQDGLASTRKSEEKLTGLQKLLGEYTRKIGIGGSSGVLS